LSGSVGGNPEPQNLETSESWKNDEIKDERRRRIEIEKSAQIIAIKLQKVDLLFILGLPV